MQRLEFLSKNPLFYGLSEKQLKMFAGLIREKKYDEGQFIARDNDNIESLCLLRSGRVKLSKYSRTGKEQIVHIYTEGEMMGLCTLFTDSLFPANAVALEKTCVYTLSKDRLEQLAYNEQTFLLNLVFALSARLAESMNLVESLSLRKAHQRLAAFLVYSISMTDQEEQINLPFSHQDLSRMLGVTPETLSRAFNRMRQKAIIHMEGRSITILDNAALNEMAEDF
ncbi:MAG: Crp/Fnr family transcriptional regulator [Spirochaetota bacterium]|nr:Crp/Fnr family transcriptional regulator [Spirochaetota bacterium]